MSKFLLALALILVVGAGCVNPFEPKPTPPVVPDPDQALCVDRCGDGECAEVVCQGTGCACAESEESCPQDCEATPNPSDFINVTTPTDDAKISNPVEVTGRARGTWYFEASFPIKVYDANNTLLGTGIATAQGDWMTEDFVPFTANITFTSSSTATGKLVLERDNPSGLPENDMSITIPVTF